MSDREPASLDARRKRNGPTVPAAVVVVTLDTSGRPFTPQTAGAFADMLNHVLEPGQQACHVYTLAPVTEGNDGRK